MLKELIHKKDNYQRGPLFVANTINNQNLVK